MWQSGHIRHFIVTYKPVFCRRIGRVTRVRNWIAASGSLIDGYRYTQPILRELKTGRTHQIRVHLAHLGFPIAGDDKYGDFARNKALMKQGLKRMFLHAHSIAFAHPLTGEPMHLVAPLAKELESFITKLDAVIHSPLQEEG